MGALFHFPRSGFVCRPYFPVRNPLAVFCRPFKALQHLTNSPL